MKIMMVETNCSDLLQAAGFAAFTDILTT